MKKIILFLILGAMFTLVGCKSAKDVELDYIISNINNKTKLDTMEEGNSKSLKRFYGLNPSEFKEYKIYTPKYTMDVEEILLIKVEDKNQIDMVESAIDSRVNRQIETFGSYGPEQCALLEDYEIKIIDNYILYVTSKKSDEIVETFKESLY